MSVPQATPSGGRRYGGRTAAEREAERREQLIAAGAELFGTLGFAATSIRAVLRQSGLAERYFYESFGSLEELLIAVHEAIHLEVAAKVQEATEAAGEDVEARARAGLKAFLTAATLDERRVRMFIELQTVAADPVRAFRRRTHATYATLMIAYGPLEAARARGMNSEALAFAVIAAISSLLDAWASGELHLSSDGLIDHAVVIIKGTVNELERA